MSKKVEIIINGEAYPCRATLGAMLRFKQETGREVTEIDASSVSDLCAYLWCCVVSASKASGKDFKMSLMDFADSVKFDDVAEWAESIMENPSPDGEGSVAEKKSE